MAITYIENGVGLHAAISKAGLRLWRENGVWLSTDDAAVQEIINSYSPLPALRLAKAEALAVQAGVQLAKGVLHQGHVYQVDEASTAKIAAMGALAIGSLNETPGAGPWPEAFGWFDAANEIVPMDAAAMYAFSQAAALYVSGIVFNGRLLKDAIAAAPDAVTLAAIDLAAGWP